MNVENPDSIPPKNKRTIQILLGALLGVLVLSWLMNTPPGLLGKSDAIAYAVCHRIGTHSYYFGGRPFSLCARCTGQYLGFIWGLIYQVLRGKKRSGFPSTAGVLLMAAIFVLYLLDGLNSVVHLYPGLDHLSFYQPTNALRLFTGLGFGIVISSVLFPLAAQTVWQEVSPMPAIRGYGDWLILIGGGIGIGFLVLTENPLITYPLILISTAGLFTLLAILYTVIWILIRKRENSFNRYQDLMWWGIAGTFSALLQIALIDLVRYLATGTWSGFLDY